MAGNKADQPAKDQVMSKPREDGEITQVGGARVNPNKVDTTLDRDMVEKLMRD
ncbi:hypothetical protein [Heliophilum fasciatum]|uniref:Uncharacterized protein n=1 Tax=Heliophilum fasciatum TaxID=35700 RepID=A0A4R2RZ70_9FIRM|nr:hypothetical protein [Heliophilum fasciatum]MCW2277975.1 hypothetical protein [Heliophilum fasciatum]TCP64405.1 hypothetical protein EDD73_110104 [Heliophilum fasciatum]